MLEFDATIIIAMISFIVFMFLMNIVLYEPMRRIVERRQNLLSTNADETTINSTTTNSLVEEKNEKLSEGRVAMRSIISEITDEAKVQKTQIIDDAKASAVQHLDNAKNDLQNEVRVVKNELKDEVINIAQNILHKVSGQDIAISGVSNERLDEVLNNGL